MVKYIYICSANFSGSTLLDMLIGSHSCVTSLGEITQLPKNLALNTACTCGLTVRCCPVWIEVINSLSEKLGIDIKSNPYSLNLGYIYSKIMVDKKHQTLIYKFIRKIKSGLKYAELRFGLSFLQTFTGNINEGLKNKFILYDTVNSVLGTKLIVDSSKSYLECVNLYKMSPESVRIILLVRDGRAVFYSGLKRSFPRKESLNSWKNVYARVLPLLKKNVNPNHVLQIRYEDLATSTKNELIKICNFIGLEFEEEMLNFKNKTHHITNGNEMRFNNSSTIKTDMIWKQKLSLNDLKYFNVRAEKINRQLAYE
ncbi:MAG: sulfotransferase [Planctomycetes bacterium]|nr:sulfotransferase [Planctomycetota bacterium]